MCKTLLTLCNDRKENKLLTFIESCNDRIRVTCKFGIIAKKLPRENKIIVKSFYNGIYSKADQKQTVCYCNIHVYLLFGGME
jgi:hypothetical protein